MLRAQFQVRKVLIPGDHQLTGKLPLARHEVGARVEPRMSLQLDWVHFQVVEQ